MKRFLIVFVKEPQKGKVKTRLEGCLSQEQCLNLYKAFLRDTIELARKVKCQVRVLAYESNGENPDYLKKIAHGFTFYKQKGKNLGLRMHNAFRFASRNGSTRTVIIGSDSPTLPLGYINAAFDKLSRNDLVLGPSFDGGYYLIGLKKPCLGLFKGIRWSSQSVLEQTYNNATQIKKKIVSLEKFSDVDEPEDLARLKKYFRKNKNAARWTQRFLKAELK